MNRIREEIDELKKYKFSTISGLNEGEKSFLPYFFDEKITVIASSADELEKYERQLASIGKRVIKFDKKLPQIYSIGERNQEIFKAYYKNIGLLAKNEYDILLLTSDSILQCLPSKENIMSNILTIDKTKKYNLTTILNKLIDMGYVRQEVITQRGEFSLRGDTLDVFAVNQDDPIRISFFDDEIDELFLFDTLSYKKIKDLNFIDIFCQTLLMSSNIEKDIIEERIFEDIKKLNLDSQAMLRLTEVINNQLDYLKNDINHMSSVFFLPFCEYFKASFFDYLPSDAKIIIDEPKLVTDKLNDIEFEAMSEFLNLSKNGEILPKAVNFYFKNDDILSSIKKFDTIALSRILSQNKIFKSEYSLNFICGQNIKYYGRILDFVGDIKNYLKNGYTVGVACFEDVIFEKIKDFLSESKIDFKVANDISQFCENSINLLKKDVPYSAYFNMEKFVFIGSFDLSCHNTFVTKKVQNSDKAKFLPQVGDYVVHQVHGVGKCIGIKNLKLSTVFRDYIVIEYKDGDILYLPSENADMISLYIGKEEPKCNKIGGTEFFKVKQKVKNSIKEMAFDLLSVYSARLNSKGFKFSQDGYLQQEFENAFMYEYTDDQKKAIRDIKNDMEQGKIMDRLLCGDVGFGKTEVALVASYKAIQDGKQVAIICPTTILCEQHYNTAMSRMRDFMVRIESINRFKTKKEQDEILKKLSNGEVDLICGTHRLFSNDVKFKDLGLVILDEEQRFGVEDKEKLKNIKKSVDVLSMSATPIPRTLHMSLVGIRDVSFLSTPPTNRKRIMTSVIDYSDSLLVDACRREINRGGQVLIVYNSVENISKFYAHVCNLLPDVKISFAHGQMSSKMLEQNIYDLYTRKTQILISTVLIENGIDLPYANTLFVIDSDKLGLSQLYQLRGRIGRSGIDAYAYFSFSKNKTLTVDSYKRLDAIMEFSDFGSGYKIALRDLEIRGAGDVLGKQQHGHMQQVGYDLYVKLLREAISELKGEEIDEFREVKIDILIPAYLPDNYIESNENRILFYTKVSKLKSIDELNRFVEETRYIYGEMPKTSLQLCKIGLIKNLAQKILIKKVKLDDFSCKITFYSDVINKPIYEFLKTDSVEFVLNQEKEPIILLKNNFNIDTMQEKLINFLIKCQNYEKK